MGPPSEKCPLLGQKKVEKIFSDFFEVGNGDYKWSRVLILFSLPCTHTAWIVRNTMYYMILLFIKFYFVAKSALLQLVTCSRLFPYYF